MWLRQCQHHSTRHHVVAILGRQLWAAPSLFVGLMHPKGLQRVQQCLSPKTRLRKCRHNNNTSSSLRPPLAATPRPRKCRIRLIRMAGDRHGLHISFCRTVPMRHVASPVTLYAPHSSTTGRLDVQLFGTTASNVIVIGWLSRLSKSSL
jgi:hypothetical protein